MKYFTTGFIIFQADKPCTLVQISHGREGVALVPGVPIARFGSSKAAMTAIKRTLDLARELRGTMVDSWDKLRPIFSNVPYVIHPIAAFSPAEKPDEQKPQNQYLM